MTASLLTEYLELSGSATRFLEARSGQSVTAKVHAQTRLNRGEALERVSTLHVGDSKPVLAAKCLLDLTSLSSDEIHRLTETNEPIGSILLASTGDDLRREKIAIGSARRHVLSHYLDTGDGEIFSKSFELWQADRFIGDLVEIVSASSLARLDRPLAKRAV